MNFYHIKDDYIEFLRAYDTTVAENKQESRPYVGVVFEIEGIRYYAPFTSPKPKHRYMKNGKDFRKIQEGQYGAINFNNMIPVPEEALIPMDFAQEPDIRYRRLLQNQYKAIKADMEQIKNTARKLRELLRKDEEGLGSYDKRIKARCCNLVLLEEVFTRYCN